jgi:hypothetical protein
MLDAGDWNSIDGIGMDGSVRNPEPDSARVCRRVGVLTPVSVSRRAGMNSRFAGRTEWAV